MANTVQNQDSIKPRGGGIPLNPKQLFPEDARATQFC
jgi:hypothetical protein